LHYNSIFWCSNCDVPLIQPVCGRCKQPGFEISNTLKPVFRKEFEVLYKEIIVNFLDIKESRIPPIMYRARNKIYSNISLSECRKAHFNIRIVDGENLGEYHIILDPEPEVICHRTHTQFSTFFIEDKTYLKKLIDANLVTLQNIEQEAIEFIKTTVEKYADMHIVCSFSGGKDSAVSAFLVKQAIGRRPLIFSNTGIEYPETINYVQTYGSFFGDVIIRHAKNAFLDLCQKLGPPSRMMRWCCSTQKAGPINEYYTQFQKGILSFDGIRRSESRLRADYPREKDNTKLIKQFSAYPIIDWNDFEVWLYILWRDLPMNTLYQWGFARIGCWGCPNNGRFDSFLLYKTHPELAIQWYNFLKKYWGKSPSNYEVDWITDGAWKKRRVKYDNEDIGLNYLEDESFEEVNGATDENFAMTQPCLNNNEYIISFRRPPEPVITEFLSVFGTLQEKKIGGLNFWEIEGPKINIKYFSNKHQLKFVIKSDENSIRFQQFIIKQINKAFNCIACGACVGSCPSGAIYIYEKKFKIDKKKCKHCLICCTSRYLSMSCVALHYLAKRKLISSSDIQSVIES